MASRIVTPAATRLVPVVVVPRSINPLLSGQCDATYGRVIARMDSTDAATDQSLVRRLATGDTAAFEQLYDRHSRAAYGLAFRILREQEAAEDVVQDAFLTVWRQADSYGEDRGAVRSWLLSIVHHRAIDIVRRRSYREDRQQDIEDTALPAANADTAAEVERNIEGQQVHDALEQLSPDQQRSIVLAYFGGYTHDEIARQLGVPLGTVKGRLRIGLQKMRRHLRGIGLEAPG